MKNYSNIFIKVKVWRVSASSVAESRNHFYSNCFGRALGLEVNKRVTSGAPNIMKG